METVEINLLFKTCRYCKGNKPLRFFAKRNEKFRHLYNRESACRECAKVRSKIWREKNPDKIKAYYPKQVEAIERYRRKNLHKYNAHLKAWRAGLCKDACEDCGEKEDLHMHHEDYSKPLEVITLCRKCHEAAHHVQN